MNNIPNSTPAPRRSLRAKILLTLVLGLVPIAAMFFGVYLKEQQGVSIDILNRVMAVFIFSFCGFMIGIMRRSLIRMIVGLNVGAAIGYLFLQSINFIFSSDWPFVRYQDIMIALLLPSCGVILCGTVCLDRSNFVRTFVYNAVVGAVAFLSIPAILYLLWTFHYFNILRFALATCTCAAILVWFLGEDQPPPIYLAIRNKLFPTAPKQ